MGAGRKGRGKREEGRGKSWEDAQNSSLFAPRSSLGLVEAVVCDRSGNVDDENTLNTIVTSPHSTVEMPWVFLVKNPNPGKDDGVNKVIDVAMTMPLGGWRSGLYRFPRVGERVFVMLTGDRAVLMGYVPDRTGSFGEFPEGGDKWTRKATALRFVPPIGAMKPYGGYDEVGFSTWDGAAEALEQRIIDGTCPFYLRMLAEDANDIEMLNAVDNDDAPRIAEVRQNYFSSPGRDSTKALSDLARELAEKYKVSDRPGTSLRLRSTGTIVQHARDGIEISTPGKLIINAGEVLVNGMAGVEMQSKLNVRAAVGGSSMTVNADAAVMRSLKLLDAETEYDSTVAASAIDGVSVAGANVRMNGLFSATMADAMGAAVVATSGELRESGAAVDLATVARGTATDAMNDLNANSGLDRIENVLSSWKAGNAPGKGPKSIVDRGVAVYGATQQRIKAGNLPNGNFRGTLSSVTAAAENCTNVDGLSGQDAVVSREAFDDIPGGNKNLTITQRELVRTKAFLEQMDTYQQTLESTVGSVVEGKSSSVTIHGHQLDLNVQVLKDLSEQKNTDAAPGAGGA